VLLWGIALVTATSKTLEAPTQMASGLLNKLTACMIGSGWQSAGCETGRTVCLHLRDIERTWRCSFPLAPSIPSES
jgi:hypothetical protein